MGDPVDTSQLAFDLPEVDAAIEDNTLPEVDWSVFAPALDPYLENADGLAENIIRHYNNPQAILVLSSMFDDEIFDNDVDSQFAKSEQTVYTAFATYQFIIDTVMNAQWFEELSADVRANFQMVMAVVYMRLSHEAALWISDDEEEEPPFLRDVDELGDLETTTKWEIGGLGEDDEEDE